MMKMKKTTKIITSVVAPAVLTATVSILSDGLPILIKPKAEDVKHVKIEHRDYPNESKELKDRKNIESAVALLNYLHTSPFKKISEKPMLINITYTLANGSVLTVAANSSTAKINGKLYAVHDKNTFLKMCTAAFFFQS